MVQCDPVPGLRRKKELVERVTYSWDCPGCGAEVSTQGPPYRGTWSLCRDCRKKREEEQKREERDEYLRKNSHILGAKIVDVELGSPWEIKKVYLEAKDGERYILRVEYDWDGDDEIVIEPLEEAG